MSEFERIVRVDTIGEGARSITIEANETERAALAARFGLAGIASLSATAEISSVGAMVVAKGHISAAITQICVATGDDVPATIEEPFALRFVPEAAGGEEVELDEGELDDIGFDGASVDLGEAVAQTLALALDPFPRAADADATLRQAGVIPEEEAGPFSALKGLRDLLKE